MPLPIRPLRDPSDGEPPKSKRTTPAAPIDESLALPALDFDSFGAGEAEDSLPGLPDLEPLGQTYSTPQLPPEPSKAEASLEIPIEELEEDTALELSDDEFDSLFNEFEDKNSATTTLDPIPAPPVTTPPLEEDPIDELDFESFFNENGESSEDSIPLPAPAPPIEENDEDEDDWDNLFEEGKGNSPATVNEDSLLLDEPFEEEEDQILPEEAPEEAAAESWEAEFDKFMEEEGEGSSESEAEESSEEEADIPEDALAPLKKGGKKKPKAKGKGKRGGKAPNPILRNLAAIPILGILFKPLLMLGSFGVFILGLIPLLAIPVVIFLIASNSVPGGNTVTGPDNSEASISNFSFSDGKANGTVTNSGEVIADVTANFTIWSYNPFGGGSFFAFDKVGSCGPTEASVDIDASAPVSATCDSSPAGLFTKASGSLSY